ncbi:MAG: response regulator [bacterium]
MPKKVLVVDDDEMVLIALEELLRSKGYQPKAVPGGEEALDALAKESFDLVVLDIIMPGMDGYEVCRRIRRQESLRDLPVVMLTAMSSEDDRKKGEAAGANLFLPKPISPQRLLSLIEAAMR